MCAVGRQARTPAKELRLDLGGNPEGRQLVWGRHKLWSQIGPVFQPGLAMY